MICIFSTKQLYEAKVIEALLANNDIDTFVITGNSTDIYSCGI